MPRLAECASSARDVFGDCTVVLKYAPGHTPGHQCLYVKLARTGGVLISGDVYHYAEERPLHRMPSGEQTTATPASRASIEHFVTEKEAQLWIGHSTSFFRNAIKSPGGMSRCRVLRQTPNAAIALKIRPK